MSGFLHLNNEQKLVEVAKMEDGKFALVFQDDATWDIYRILYAPVSDKHSFTYFAVDLEYKAPHYHDRIHLYEEDRDSNSGEYVCDTFFLVKVLNTQEEADQLADKMSELVFNYSEETKAFRLKLEIGISSAINLVDDAAFRETMESSN